MYKLIFILLILTSCSYQFHEKKFYQKGGTFKCEQDVITKTDTIWKDGKMIIVTKDSIVSKPIIEYVPKYVYRYRYLTAKSESKASIKKAKVHAKKDTKIAKQKEKSYRTQTRKENKNKWWYWLIIGMPVGIIVYKGLGLLIRKT